MKKEVENHINSPFLKDYDIFIIQNYKIDYNNKGIKINLTPHFKDILKHLNRHKFKKEIFFNHCHFADSENYFKIIHLYSNFIFRFLDDEEFFIGKQQAIAVGQNATLIVMCADTYTHSDKTAFLNLVNSLICVLDDCYGYEI